MSIKNLDAFFNPKRIAIIGASEDRVYETAFKRAGAVRVDEILDLFT